MKTALYFFQTILLYIVFFIYAILPLDTASALGGFVGRMAGHCMGASRKARKHIDMAMPDLSEAEKKKIITGMWDNLGRTLAEYPHLEKIARERVQVENVGIIEAALKEEKPVILIAAHLANWEISGASLYIKYNRPLNLTYRAMNNPFADKLLMQARTLKGKLPAYPKSRDSARQILMALKNNQCLGILIDQKYNEGIVVPFFGIPAMTNPVAVPLAQKFKCPLIFVQTIRTKGANFTIRVHPPLELFDAEGKPLTAETILGNAHTMLEGWVREHPEQWLWLHRRWDSKALKT